MEKEEWDNRTSPVEFLLLGLSNVPKPQVPLFLLSLMIYMVTMFSNMFIVVLVVVDWHLHTPMYVFLGNFSIVEICYTSTILPRLLVSFLTEDITISAQGCMTQFFFFGCFAGTECYLLATMSYDRYLAICQPLLYASLMNWTLCLQLVAGSWLAGLLMSTIVTGLFSKLQFCGPNAIDHFFCDFAPLLELACSDTTVLSLVTFIICFLDVVFPFILTLVFYICIIVVILRIPTSMGRQKAFSTCSSHLIVVTVFYGTLIVVYMIPRTASLRQLNKVLSFFYTILTPIVNPLLYSLRNREVKGAFENALRKTVACIESSYWL
ncbi:olfactory receptor 1020-like [Grus americana]|uniref:Olfactory receptor n=2 Tax=Grus TaxID=9114 RepID=A0ABC9X8V6_GRUJA|nr:olfactory receptor 1020-like [Grus americana]